MSPVTFTPLIFITCRNCLSINKRISLVTVLAGKVMVIQNFKTSSSSPAKFPSAVGRTPSALFLERAPNNSDVRPDLGVTLTATQNSLCYSSEERASRFSTCGSKHRIYISRHARALPPTVLRAYTLVESAHLAKRAKALLPLSHFVNFSMWRDRTRKTLSASLEVRPSAGRRTCAGGERHQRCY